MHTFETWHKAKWPTSRKGDYTIVTNQDKQPVLEQSDYEGFSISETRMDRAITCVNACAGIEDPATAIKEARVCLNELIGQVVQAKDGFGIWPYENSGSMTQVLERAKAALAKLKGVQL